MTMRHLAITLTIGLAATLAAAAGAESAYDRLDSRRLADALSALGMTEMLDALASDPAVSGTVAGKLLLVESKVGSAESAAPVDRDRLLAEAVAILKDVVSQTPADDRDLLEQYRRKVRLAEIAWWVRIQPLFQKVRALYGSKADRQRLVELTADAPPFMRTVDQAMKRTMEDWRRSSVKLATVVAPLEETQLQAAFRFSWIEVARAMALDEADTAAATQRKQLLMDALADATDMIKRGEELGVTDSALLLAGVACRELRKYDEAADLLGRALADAEAAPGVRLESAFEAARNLIEQAGGRAADAKAGGVDLFARAAEAVDAFRKTGLSLLGAQPEGAMQVDGAAALLTDYLYQTQTQDWADKARGNPQKAQELEAKAQEARDKAQSAILAFTGKYTDPGVRQDFLRTVANRYQGRTDLDALNSPVLVGLGMGEAAEGDGARAVEIFRKVLARQDKISQELRPLAMWQLGLALSALNDPKAAGEVFFGLAKDYPKEARSYEAAVNAVTCYNTAVESDAALRSRLMAALELLLSGDRWPEKAGDKAGRYYDLALQYDRMAQEALAGKDSNEQDKQIAELLTKAADAYGKVPAGHPRHMEAQHWRLELLAQLPPLAAATPAEQAAMYGQLNLVGQLQAYGKQAAQAAGGAQAEAVKASDPAAKARQEALARDLARWAAEAEFREAVILYEMGQRDEVWAKLEALAEKHKDTPVLIEATEFHIRKLIEEGRQDPARLAEAIRKAESFRTSHPKEAEQIIRVIVQQIRQRIRQARGDSRQAEALKAYRQAYASFAGDLFGRVQGQDIKDRYALTQMYAESLVEKGSLLEAQGGGAAEEARKCYQQALSLFRDCQAFDEKDHSAEAAQIDQRYDQAVGKVRAAAGNMTATKQLAEEYFRAVQQVLPPQEARTAPQAEAIRGALELLGASQNQTEQAQTLQWAARRLEQGYETLRTREKSRTVVDAANVLGLARCHRAMRQHAEAAAQYNAVLRGLDRRQDPVLFWQVEVESCQNALEGFKDRPDVMKQLAAHIRQLLLEEASDPARAVLFARLRDIQAQAEKAGGASSQ